MSKRIIVFAFILFFTLQVGETNNVDNAEAALGELRQAITETLNDGFMKHIEMTADIEKAALDTKDAGAEEISKRDKQMISSRSIAAAVCYKTVKKVMTSSSDLAACVDDKVEEALKYLYNAGTMLFEMTLKTIYDGENGIIFCGRSDDACLSRVTDQIKEKTDGLADLVAQQVAEDRRAVDELIGTITACADESVAKIDHMIKMCQI